MLSCWLTAPRGGNEQVGAPEPERRRPGEDERLFQRIAEPFEHLSVGRLTAHVIQDFNVPFARAGFIGRENLGEDRAIL